jgi:tetratricopeptide (TPR) repeat protein
MPSASAVGPVTRLLDNRAQVLFDEGRFEEAIEAAEASIESARRLLQEDNPESLGELLDSLLVAGDIKRHTGLMEAAEAHYQEVLRHARRAGSLARQAALAEAGLGDIHEERGKIVDALRFYESAVKTLDALGTAYTEECCRLRNNLAMIYKDERDYPAAESHLITGIQRIEAGLGRYNPTNGTLYSNLAAVYSAVGHYDEAREMALLARDIRRQILPANHPENAQSLSNLGAIHYALDDFDAAIDCFAEAVEAMDSNVETDPQDYEVVVSNYIDLLRMRGEDAKADEISAKSRSRYQHLNRVRAGGADGDG